MTEDSSATPEVRSGAHPYVCPQCDRRTGVYDIATGISACAPCEVQWRGPRVMFFHPNDLQTPAGIAEVMREINAGLNSTTDEENPGREGAGTL